MYNNRPRKEGTRPHCQKFACMIQDCLERNRQDQSKCQKEIDLIVNCCYKLHQMGKKSVCCGQEIQARFPKESDIIPTATIQSQIPSDSKKKYENLTCM